MNNREQKIRELESKRSNTQIKEVPKGYNRKNIIIINSKIRMQETIKEIKHEFPNGIHKSKDENRTNNKVNKSLSIKY